MDKKKIKVKQFSNVFKKKKKGLVLSQFTTKKKTSSCMFQMLSEPKVEQLNFTFHFPGSMSTYGANFFFAPKLLKTQLGYSLFQILDPPQKQLFLGGGHQFFFDHLKDEIWVYKFTQSNLWIFGMVKKLYRPAGTPPATPGHSKNSKYTIFQLKTAKFGVRVIDFFSDNLNDKI